MSLLFEDLFKKFNSDLKIVVKKGLTRTNKSSVFDVTTAMSPKTITQVCARYSIRSNCSLMNMVQGMVSTISSGNWNLQRFKMERAGDLIRVHSIMLRSLRLWSRGHTATVEAVVHISAGHDDQVSSVMRRVTWLVSRAAVAGSTLSSRRRAKYQGLDRCSPASGACEWRLTCN
jgi:hypothetical protein